MRGILVLDHPVGAIGPEMARLVPNERCQVVWDELTAGVEPAECWISRIVFGLEHH
jgi:hypothetical protein